MSVMSRDMPSFIGSKHAKDDMFLSYCVSLKKPMPSNQACSHYL